MVTQPHRAVFISTVSLLLLEALVLNTLVHVAGGLGFWRWFGYTVLILIVGKLYWALARGDRGGPPPPRPRLGPSDGPPGSPPGSPALLPVSPRIRTAEERKAIPAGDERRLMRG